GQRAGSARDGGTDRLEGGRGASRGRRARMWVVDEPEPQERRQQEPGEARPGPLAQGERSAEDGDERLDLLEHDRGDEVAVEERLGEEDRRDRLLSRPDRARRCDL